LFIFRLSLADENSVIDIATIQAYNLSILLAPTPYCCLQVGTDSGRLASAERHSFKEGAMPTSRKLVVPLLLALMLLVAVPAVAAAPSATTTHETVRGTVDWSLTPAQCSSLQVPLSGTGERFAQIITKVNADGSSR